MRRDLSTLSNAIEKFIFTAQEPWLANRSGDSTFLEILYSIQRFNFFESLMRRDLSTLSNAIEKFIFTAQEPWLANRSGVIVFSNFHFAN